MRKYSSLFAAVLFVMMIAATSASSYAATHTPRRSTAATPTITYASVSKAGLFKSIDPSGSWVSTSALPSDPIALATGDPAHWFNVYAGLHSGVYVSHDGGKTWTNSLHDRVIDALLAPPDVTDTVFAGTDSGIYRSSDAGATWTLVGASSHGVNSLAEAPQSSSILYAGGANGWVAVSHDGGGHWSPFRHHLSRHVTIYSLAVSTSDQNTVYAATSDGMWRASGGAWSPLRHGVSSKSLSSIVVTTRGIFASATSDSTLYISSDGGATWTGQTIPGLTAGITVLAQDPQQQEALVLGDGNGTIRYSSDSGATWNASGGTVAGAVGNAILAVAMVHRQPLPVDGVSDPHQSDIRFVSDNGGHTVRGPFLTFWQANATVTGAPETEQFSDHARGDANAQYFQNIELLQQGDTVVPAPLGLEALPPGYDGSGSYSVDPLFRSFWQAHGGQAVLGAAVSPLLKEPNGDGSGMLYPVQYFRNARLEYHAEVGAVEVSKLGEQALQAMGWL